MAKTYKDIVAEIAKLQVQAADLKQKEVAGVVGRIKEAIAHYGLTAADLGLAGAAARGSRGSKTGTTAKRARGAKYRDENGNTWVGRGPRPAWLRTAIAQGRTLEEFSVDGARVTSTVESARVAKTRGRTGGDDEAGPSTGREAASVGASPKNGRGKRMVAEAAPAEGALLAQDVVEGVVVG